ncbi:S-layer homology domain-containing protein [Gracilibacillus sp. YIM 98692]|uniref:S-layer homology domain-containing protein n=1 Tax=Gracilibacillus sp. YIM 98692 TaxID=2663532 RepID=UPI001969FBCF|nr:S-layer homology domain-containing protein [Gracilibacillus sp. YIM 98692]
MEKIIKALKYASTGLVFTGALYISPQIAQADGFSDVDTSDWAYEHIMKMEQLNIINGYPDGTFRGNNSIRREHVAVMMDRALDLPIHQSYIPFEDVSDSNDYLNAIKAVQQAGIFTGDRGNFMPKANLTRAQMAKVIVEAFNLPIKKGHAFSDVADSNWAKDYISTIAYYDISTGSKGNYMPDNDVTRRQFATLIDRVFNLQLQEEQPPTEQAKEKKYRGTYIWEAETLINEKEKIIQFAKEENINLLYTRLDLTQPFSAYSDFVAEANQAGIEIHAMGGHPSWALKEEEARMLKLVDYVKEYNNTVDKNQQFTGIHLDVEPYVTPSWAENEQEVLSQWMNNIELFVKETKRESNLEASMDLAMWFDDTKTPGHPDTPFYQWVINQMDHTSIMAFRDQAKGSGGIIDMAQNEIDYAESTDKNMIISVEIKESKNNPHISFHEEGAAVMEEQLDIVDEELSSNAAYNGYIVHAYRYWKNH